MAYELINKKIINKYKIMNDWILILIMATLGLGLSTVIPSSASSRLTKSAAWFIAGIFSKFK